MVVGGHHATLCPQEFNAPFIDVVVIGEGVPAFKEIVARWSKKQIKAFDNILGLGLPRDGEFHFTAPRPFPSNLTTYPIRKFLPRTSIRKTKGHSEQLYPLKSVNVGLTRAARHRSFNLNTRAHCIAPSMSGLNNCWSLRIIFQFAPEIANVVAYQRSIPRTHWIMPHITQQILRRVQLMRIAA